MSIDAELTTGEIFETVRRAAPFAALPTSAFEGARHARREVPGRWIRDCAPALSGTAQPTVCARPGGHGDLRQDDSRPGLFSVFMVGEKASRVSSSTMR